MSVFWGFLGKFRVLYHFHSVNVNALRYIPTGTKSDLLKLTFNPDMIQIKKKKNIDVQ